MKTVAQELASTLRSVFHGADLEGTLVLFPDHRLGVTRQTTVQFSVSADGRADVRCDPEIGPLGRPWLRNLKRYVLVHCLLRWPKLENPNLPQQYFLNPTDPTHGDPILFKSELKESGTDLADLWRRLKADMPNGLDTACERLRLPGVPQWASVDGMARVLVFCPWMPIVREDWNGQTALWVPCDATHGAVEYARTLVGTSQSSREWYPLVMDPGADEPNPLPYGLKPFLAQDASCMPVAWAFPGDLISVARKLHNSLVRTRRGSSHGDPAVPTGLGRWLCPKAPTFLRAKAILP